MATTPSEARQVEVLQELRQRAAHEIVRRDATGGQIAAALEEVEALDAAIRALRQCGEAVGYVYAEHLKLNGPDWGPAPLYHDNPGHLIPLYALPPPPAEGEAA